MFGVNQKRWNSLDPKVRSFLETEIAGLEDRIWKGADEETQQGFDCNTGKDSCKLGTKANMTFVPVSDADRTLLKKVLSETVVPKWAERCSGDCVANWNASVGKIVDIQAKSN